MTCTSSIAVVDTVPRTWPQYSRPPSLHLALRADLILDAVARGRARGQPLVADRLPARLAGAVAAVGETCLRVVDVGQLRVDVTDDREIAGALEHLRSGVGDVAAGGGVAGGIALHVLRDFGQAGSDDVEAGALVLEQFRVA